MKPILVSEHGRQRIKERLNTSDKKIQKLVEKAWRSTNVDVPKVNRVFYKTLNIHEKTDRVCKCLMGYVFVFAIDRDKIVFITVL
jgi:hypothetical protein